ncbi:hypothetical protein M758_4G137700 [Ceratodon purpureus]|nr:hypothetical protein M758_4G137700 [Ceratodon purpureus]
MAVTNPRFHGLQVPFLLLLLHNCCIKSVMDTVPLIRSLFHINDCPPKKIFRLISTHSPAHYFSPFTCLHVITRFCDGGDRLL